VLVALNTVGVQEAAGLSIKLAVIDFATQVLLVILGFVLVFSRKSSWTTSTGASRRRGPTSRSPCRWPCWRTPVSRPSPTSRPVAIEGRELPPGLRSVVALLAPTLLAALVVVSTFASGRSLVLDPRAAGMAAAAVAIVLRAPLLVTVATATVVAALVRALV